MIMAKILNSLIDPKKRAEILQRIKDRKPPKFMEKKPEPEVPTQQLPPRTDESVQQKLVDFAVVDKILQSNTAEVYQMLAAGASVNGRGRSNMTPLHAAAFRGLDLLTENLIGKGASVDLTDDQGATALFYAVSGDHLKTCKHLIAGGADVNAKTTSGDTALQCAIRRGNKDTEKLLRDSGATE